MNYSMGDFDYRYIIISIIDRDCHYVFLSPTSLISSSVQRIAALSPIGQPGFELFKFSLFKFITKRICVLQDWIIFREAFSDLESSDGLKHQHFCASLFILAMFISSNGYSTIRALLSTQFSNVKT